MRISGAMSGKWLDPKKIFTTWFETFIKFRKVSMAKSALHLLDGQASHTKNKAILDLVREHGVHIPPFPPHCTQGSNP